MRLTLMFLITIFLALFFQACSLNSDFYGITEITNDAGEKLYFHRAARGLNYDVMFLSAKSAPCLNFDESTDIDLGGMGDKFFCKFDKGHLQIYVPGETKVPPGFSPEIKITQNVVNNLEFFELEKNYQTKNLQLVEVALDEDLDCRTAFKK